MKLIGFVLLLPTVLIAAMGAQAGSDGAPIAFGLWMFFGLPTMLGAIFVFKKDTPVDHPAVVKTEESPSGANVRMMAAMERAIQADANIKMIAATEHTKEGMAKKPTAPVFGKRSD